MARGFSGGRLGSQILFFKGPRGGGALFILCKLRWEVFSLEWMEQNLVFLNARIRIRSFGTAFLLIEHLLKFGNVAFP